MENVTLSKKKDRKVKEIQKTEESIKTLLKLLLQKDTARLRQRQSS